MKLASPIIITPRLLPGVRVGNAFISIECDGLSFGRLRYRWHIDLPNGQEFTCNDLYSGVGAGTLQGGLSSLLSFLGAFAESHSYALRTGDEAGENSNLFPEELKDWAMENSEEIDMLSIELEENPYLIVE